MAMLLSSSMWSKLSTTRRNPNGGSADAGGNAVQVPSAHQPPSWLGWLLLITLLVMLNTHLFITLAAGIDQYSLYAADSSVPQLYPAVLAQQPYPVLLTFLVNVVLALLAYGIYRMIWRYFATPRATSSDGPERNPFKQNAVALAIPVFIAIAPSLVLCYTVLKPYFVIVGALIAIVLCIVAALKDPNVDLDSSTRGYWFNVAVIATFVMMTLAVVVTLYFQFAPVEPPNDNLLWRLEWDPYPLEEFEQRVRGGMLLFGLVSIAYMVVVLGGVLLATLHPPGIGTRAEQRPPAPEPSPLHGANITVYISVEGTAKEWAAEVLTQLDELLLGSEQAPSYLAVMSGLEKRISEGKYRILVDEKSGFLDGVDLFVDQSTGTVKTRFIVERSTGTLEIRRGSSLESVSINPHPKNARYRALCLYSRMPDHKFTTTELETRLEEAVGQKPANPSDIVSNLRSRGVPLESAGRETYIRDGTKVCFVDRLRTNS